MIPSRLIPALGLSLLSTIAFAQSPGPAPTNTKAHATAAYAQQPLAFQPNRGQAAHPVQYLSHGRDYTVLLQPTTATLVLARPDARPDARPEAPGKSLTDQKVTSEAIRMTLAGANPAAVMAPTRQLPGYVSYLHGNDRAQWQTGIPTYAATRITQPYPGIDLVYYGNQRNLEYDFLVAPHADAAQIRLNLQGATPILEPTGELRLQAAATPAATDIVFHKPVLYQQTGTNHTPVEGAFNVASNGEVSFQVGPYDHARELVIDPVISYASYFGGPAEDEINGIAINSANQLYAVGQTRSLTLPSTTGEYQTTNVGTTANNNNRGAFVTKFSADGSTILWTTFLSGGADSFAAGVAVNAADQPYVVGATNSCAGTAFPFTPDAVQPLCSPVGNNTNAGGTTGSAEISSNTSYDLFLVKLSSDGKSLLYGTYLGGSTGNDFPSAIVLDATGRPYITGETLSTTYFYNTDPRGNDTPSYPVNNHGTPGFGLSNYPTTANAFYSNTTESKLYATQISTGTQGPQDEQGFITVLSADLHSFVYSSLIGGPGTGGCGNGACNTNSFAVAVNAAGQAFIGGNTVSALWPVTAKAFVPACTKGNPTNCPETGWLAGFDPTKSGVASLLFNTYMNGTSAGKDGNGNILPPGGDVFGLIADSAGNIIATGDTNANNYPTTTGTFQPACALIAGNGNGQTNTCSSAFLTKLTPTGAAVWSTYYRGTSPGYFSIGRGLAVDPANNVYVVGSGNDPSLPLLRPFASNPTASLDYFVSEFSADASTLLAGSYVGIGGGFTANNGMALDAAQNAYFSGSQGVNPYGGTSFPLTANAADKSQQGSDGFVLKVVMQPADSTTTLTINPTSTTPGTPVTFTVNVTGNTSGVTPTKTVTLTNGTGTAATTLGTITLANGTGTYTTSALAAGTYSVIATYSGDGTYNSSASTAKTLTIQSTPTVAFTATPTTAAPGAAIMLSATVASTAGTPTGPVYFMDGAAILGSTVLANGVATYSTTTLSAGTHTLTARYGGDTNFATFTSTPVTVTITAPAVASFVITATPTTISAGSATTLTATVSSTTNPAPTGTVTFYEGTNSYGGTTLANGISQIILQSLPVGTHTLHATYTGDAIYPPATSSNLVVTVIPEVSTLTLASSAPIQQPIAPVTFTATFTNTGLFPPSGVVSFYDGTSLLGTGTIANRVASYTTGALSTATHTISATYAGDANFAAVTSNSITQVIIVTKVILTSNPTSLTIPHGQSATAVITATPVGGFTGTVNFSSFSLPNNASVSYNPTSLTFVAGSGPMSTTLTVNTATNHASLAAPSLFGRGRGQTLAILWLPGSALALFGLRRKGKATLRKTMLFSLLALCSLGSFTALTGCGGGQSFNTVTPGTYTIPVVATASDGSTQTLNLTITVQ